MLLKSLREKVISISLKMMKYNLVYGTWGNVSARDPETNYVALTPSGMEYDQLKPEDIVITDLDGKVVDGKRKPTIETPMHILMYRKRPEINGVIHTHSVFSTALSVANQNIPVVISEMASMVGGDVPVANYANCATDTLGCNALEAMGDRLAVLLKNHGVLALGADLDTALNVALIVEDSAKVYYIAKTLGNVELVPESEIPVLQKGFYESYGQK